VNDHKPIECLSLVHHQEIDLNFLSYPREDSFVPPSPAMAPENVVARVGSRL
jgi:hypothetical protein